MNEDGLVEFYLFDDGPFVPFVTSAIVWGMKGGGQVFHPWQSKRAKWRSIMPFYRTLNSSNNMTDSHLSATTV